MAKIIVTGGEGFIGSNLITFLEKRGHHVLNLDLKIGHDVSFIDEWMYDILYGEQWDYIFHLAAESRVQPSFKNPDTAFHTNVHGTTNMCELARRTNAKLIYAGSSSKHHDPHTSPYAASKWMGEEVIKTYKKCYGINAEIARFYNVYGPGEALDKANGNVIGIWRAKIQDREILQIVGDGEQRRDFTHVNDIVDGLYKIAMSSEKHEDAWELGTGVNYSINELADMFIDKFAGEAQFEYIPNQAGNYRFTLNENTDAQKRLGWDPTDQLENHIKTLKHEE